MALIATGHGLIDISFSQYHVWGLAPGRPALIPTPNGLLKAEPVDDREQLIVVSAATGTGLLRLTVETYEAAPPLVLDDWDDVMEVSQLAALPPTPLVVELREAGASERQLESLLKEWPDEPRDFPEFVEVRVAPWADAPAEGLPALAVRPGSGVRLRVHARGRDEVHKHSYEALARQPVEEHLLQMWPAPEAEGVCHRLTDHYGQLMREQETASEERRRRHAQQQSETP